MAKNNRTIKWISAICGIVVIVLALAGLIWAAATQNANFETSKVKQVEMCVDIDANTFRLGLVEDEVIGMKRDIGHIREGIGRVETTQSEILKELRKN